MELEVVMGMGWRTGYSGDLWGSVQAQLGSSGGCPTGMSPTRMSSEMGQQGAGTEGRPGFCPFSQGQWGPWEDSKPVIGALATRRAQKCFPSESWDIRV